jgi:hypothetical protein
LPSRVIFDAIAAGQLHAQRWQSFTAVCEEKIVPGRGWPGSLAASGGPALPGSEGRPVWTEEIEGIAGIEGERSLNATHAPLADCCALKKLVLTTCPIHDVPVAGPKQLQLKARAEGVGVGATGVGAVTSDGTFALGIGAASCAGALGGGTGASKGFGAGNCAHTLARSGAQHSVTINPAAIAMAAATFRILNATLPLDSRVTISRGLGLERGGAFGYNRAHDSLQVRPHFASVRGPAAAALLPASSEHRGEISDRAG